MMDRGVIAVYSVLAAVTLFLIVQVLRKDRHRRLALDALLMFTMLLGWQVARILFFASRDFDVSFYLFDLNLPFLAFMTMGVLLFTLRFYSLEAYCSPPMITILSIIPIITTILCLTPYDQEYLRRGLVILEVYPHHAAVFGRGFWFWVHAGYCYAVTLAACAVILVQFRRLPQGYRASSRLLIYGMLGSLAGNVLVVLQLFPTSLDFSLVGSTITAVFFYFAMRRNVGLNYLMKARDKVFKRLDEAVLILDDDGLVVARNDRAKALMRSLDLPEDQQDYEGFLQTLRHHSMRFSRDAEEIGMDYYLDDAQGQTYNLREKQVSNRRGAFIGTFVTCADVTRNRALITQLENEAGLDALTGLLNRRSLEKEQALLDDGRNLPLGVIVGDINSLKEINERLGRPQGDMAMRLVADVLSSVCPPRARVARVENDEFLALVPDCTIEQLYAILHGVRAALAGHPKNTMQVTLSMGVAVKTHQSERLVSVILQADHHMRIEKEARLEPKGSFLGTRAQFVRP